MTSRVKRAKYKAASEPYQTLTKCIRFEKKEKEKKKEKTSIVREYTDAEFYENPTRILILEIL